MKPKSASN